METEVSHSPPETRVPIVFFTKNEKKTLTEEDSKSDNSVDSQCDHMEFGSDSSTCPTNLNIANDIVQEKLPEKVKKYEIKKTIRKKKKKSYYVKYNVSHCPHGYFHVVYSTDKKKMRIHCEWEEYGSGDASELSLQEELGETSEDQNDEDINGNEAQSETVSQRDFIGELDDNLTNADTSTRSEPVKHSSNDSGITMDESDTKSLLIAAKPRDENCKMKQERYKKWLMDRKQIRRFTKKIYVDDCTNPFCLKNSQNKEDHQGKKKSYKLTTELRDIEDLAWYYNKLEQRAEFSESSDEDNDEYESELFDEISTRYYVVNESSTI